MLKLHFAPKSRALRVVWLLEELGLPYALERYALGDAEMRGADYRAIHPLGRVPVLEDGPVRLFESGAILEYILSRYGNGSLRPSTDSADYPDYLQWLHFSEGMIMPPINNYMVETLFLPPERRSDEHAARAKRLLARMLIAVDTALVGRDYLASSFSAADIMTGSGVMTAFDIGVEVSELSNLGAYVERLRARTAYGRALNA